MNSKWWERPTCFICDYWWLILLLIIGFIGLLFWYLFFKPRPKIFEIPKNAESIELCVGQTAYQNRHITITFPDSHVQKADIIFAFDVSGSMSDMIVSAQNQAAFMIEKINDVIPDSYFGLIEFSNEIKLHNNFTNNKADIISNLDLINNINLRSDAEVYGDIIESAISDEIWGWRADSEKFLIIFADESTESNSNYQVQHEKIEQNLNRLISENIKIIFIDPLGESLVKSYWEPIVIKTGGLYKYIVNTEDIAEVVSGGIFEISNQKKLESQVDQYEYWFSSKIINTHQSDTTIDFEVYHEFQLPEGFHEYGKYSVIVSTMDNDGILQDQYSLKIKIPKWCVIK